MARGNDKLGWILAGLAGFMALTYFQRKTIMLYGAQALQAGKELLFSAALPSRAQSYHEMILTVSKETGVDPFVIFAIGDRESLWGQALDENLTGDHTPRASPPWPYSMPPDGYGWGRGVMQVDEPRATREGHEWRDSLANIRLGVKLYQEKLAEVTASPSGSWNLTQAQADKVGVPVGRYPALAVPPELASQAAMAAYNAGSANVRMAYSASVPNGLDPQAAWDRMTTGGDYSSDVWERMLSAVARFQS